MTPCLPPPTPRRTLRTPRRLRTPPTSSRRTPRAPLALLVLLAGGCVFWVDDPAGWSVVPDSASPAAAGPGVHCSSYGDSCSCEAAPDDLKGEGKACGGDAHPNWLCCGDIQYPATNTSCRCERFSCKVTSAGCECRLGSSYGPDDHCDPKPGASCCRNNFSCQCGVSSCSETDRVDRCEVKIMRCSEGRGPRCSPLSL